MPSQIRLEYDNAVLLGGWGKVTSKTVHGSTIFEGVLKFLDSFITTFQEQDLNKLGYRNGNKFTIRTPTKQLEVNYAFYPFNT